MTSIALLPLKVAAIIHTFMSDLIQHLMLIAENFTKRQLKDVGDMILWGAAHLLVWLLRAVVHTS